MHIAFKSIIVIFTRFPGKPDSMMTSPELLEERRAALEQYLNDILECPVYREHPEMVK